MADPINAIAEWLQNLLTGWGMAPGLALVIRFALGVIVIATVMLVLDIFLVWLERKVVARFQVRLGPNRLGRYGLLQPFADVLKLLIKEDTTPLGADKFLYNLAPIIALATVLLLWGVIPYAPTIVGADINVGVLYIVAVGAIGTLGIIIAGWSSNNKYALLGAFRAVALMISYEVPMVLALLIPVMLADTMGINAIVASQNVWFIFVAPVAALIFLISAIAELGRAPFDMTEAESELVAGYVTEYSGMKFGLFYAGELLHALTMGALFATLFLGGWRGPFVGQIPILGAVYLLVKALFMYWVIMWVRYTLPRVRIDHMLSLNWKFFTPLALVVLTVTALLDRILEGAGASTLVYTLVMLGANLLVGWITLTLLRSYARRERVKVAEPRPVAVPPEPTGPAGGPVSAAPSVTPSTPNN